MINSVHIVVLQASMPFVQPVVYRLQIRALSCVQAELITHMLSRSPSIGARFFVIHPTTALSCTALSFLSVLLRQGQQLFKSWLLAPVRSDVQDNPI